MFTEEDLGEWVYQLAVTDDKGARAAAFKKITVQEKVASIKFPEKSSIGAASGQMNGDDYLLGVFINGEAVAYPAKVVYPYGLVNDVVGGKPVLIVFCEACQTGFVKSREVAGRVLTFQSFGGTLEEEDYRVTDEETGTTWHTVYGTGDDGPLKGNLLEDINFTLTSWDDWLEEHPDTSVLLN